MRTILFTGKGGVGKTTIAAATAIRSAAHGHRTLVISTDVAHSLADALDLALGNEPRPVGALPLEAAELDTTTELERYWGDIKRRIAAVLRREGIDAGIAGELAVLPGIDEVLTLVRIKRYHDEGVYDVLVVDSAPTGGAMRLLSAPDLTSWYTRSLLGMSHGLLGVALPALRGALRLPFSEDLVVQRLKQLFGEIEALRVLLCDGQRTSVRLVLNPERMALLETQRAYTYLSLFGLWVDAAFVNRVLPDQVKDPFFARWKVDQAAHRQEAKLMFAPIPVYEVPLLPQEVVGVARLTDLACCMYGDADPTPPLATERPLRFYHEGRRYVLALRVSGVQGGTVDLEKHADELSVRLGAFRRSLVLPQYLAGRQPSFAQVEDGWLKISFDDPA